MQTDPLALEVIYTITGQMLVAAIVAIVLGVLALRRRGRLQLDWTNPAAGRLRLSVDEDGDASARDSRRPRKRRRGG